MICVENNLILIVLIFAMISVTFCSNYCDFEKTICFNKKHIGCKTSVFGKVQPYVMNPMADELKQYILHELNTFRNDIAMGKYEQDGFPKASNLRTLRWNNEFSYLAKLCIEKLPNWSIWPCFATNKFETPILKRLSNVGNSTGDQLFHIFIDFFTSTKELKLKYNEFYHENNYEIGCSLGSITVNGDILNNASCILNKFTIGSPLNTSYDFGEPCSKCGMWNEVCDDIYPGLCAPMNIKGEKGAIGLQGVTGSTGPIGPPGIKGDAGIKGEIGENGSIGPSGLPGMDGQRGKIGPVGPPGENGIDGSPGQKGESGRDGIPGFVGLKGEKGSSGQIGNAGIKGESGTNGIPGSPGLPGDNCKPETFGTQYFTDSQYPMSFWILYSVIGILVCASFIFTWKMNRPPKLGSSNSTMELR